MQVYVIRHGLSEGNAAGVIQGHTDSPLSEIGLVQATMLGRYFRREKINPDAIYASPLNRALQTAETIVGELDSPPEIVTIDGLKEADVGTLSGLTMEEAYEKYPGGWNLDINKWLDFSRADGESFEEFFGRVEGAVEELMVDWDLLEDRTVFFVVHAGTMRPLLKKLLDASSDMMYFTFGNCTHVRVEYRQIKHSVRKVLSDVVRIEKVAELLGEPDPCENFDDPVGKKIG